MRNVIASCNRVLYAHASGMKVLAMLVLAVVSFYIMAFVIAPAFQEVTSGLRLFDLNFGLNAEKVYAELPAYTDESRRLYIWFAAVDYVYPAALAGFFALLWAWMFRNWPGELFTKLAGSGVLLLPFIFTLLDWSENVGFLFVIFSYPVEYPAVANLAGSLKAAKPMFELLVLLCTLIFVGIAVRNRRN